MLRAATAGRTTPSVAPVRYAVGLDFGTESGRAVLVDLVSGAEFASTIHPYPTASELFRWACAKLVE